MNVLLLTPDAVGGTLLARVLTIYMQFHQFDNPVINVGHVELGLEKYFCPNFNQEIIRSNPETEFQSLNQITQILKSVDHHKIIKLPHYNMCSRQDPADQLVPFYQYLNKNYFIISCRRDNLFEHALSWSISKVTNALNVYNTHDKINIFLSLYQKGLNIDPISVVQSLEVYRKYIKWCDDHFQIASYYTYENHVGNLEKYILSLPLFVNQPKLVSWKEVYGQDFNDWNRSHYFSSDLGTLALNNQMSVENTSIKNLTYQDNKELVQDVYTAWNNLVEKYKQVSDPSWPEIHSLADFENLPEHIKKECIDGHDLSWFVNQVYLAHGMTQNQYNNAYNTDNNYKLAPTKINGLVQHIQNQHKDFLDSNSTQYNATSKSIARMQELGIVPTGVPIKKQTLAEKKLIVKNFDQCLDTYNNWIVKYPDLGMPISNEKLSLAIQKEHSYWNNSQNLSLPELK